MGGRGQRFTIPSRVIIMCLFALSIAALSPMIGTAAGQSPNCFTVRCVTVFSAVPTGALTYVNNTSGEYAVGVTYSWQNSNTCGLFYAPFSSSSTAIWSYGAGVTPACTTFAGNVTVSVTIVVSSGTYKFTCTDPNGGSGASLTVAGPVGVNTCVANPSNPAQRGPAVDQYGVGTFYAQQSSSPPTSSSTNPTSTTSTSSAPSTSTTQSSTGTQPPGGTHLFLSYQDYIVALIAAAVVAGATLAMRTRRAKVPRVSDK